MNKTFLAFFFTIMFLSLAIVPTIIMAFDDSIDISFIYDVSEEEEEKEKENKKEFELCIVDLDVDIEDFRSSENSQHSECTFKNYPKPHLNLISPPPDFKA